MKPSYVLVLFICIGAMTVYLQQASGRGADAKQVVMSFVEEDTHGARLTPEGWRRSDSAFGQPSPPPTRPVIIVIAQHYGVSETATKDYVANFEFGYEELGRISADLILKGASDVVDTTVIGLDRFAEGRLLEEPVVL